MIVIPPKTIPAIAMPQPPTGTEKQIGKLDAVTKAKKTPSRTIHARALTEIQTQRHIRAKVRFSFDSVDVSTEFLHFSVKDISACALYFFFL
jgi:hypothetical protein